MDADTSAPPSARRMKVRCCIVGGGPAGIAAAASAAAVGRQVMLVERYAESISRSGGVGIADSVVREFMRMQQSQASPDPEPAPIEILPGDTSGAHR